MYGGFFTGDGWSLSAGDKRGDSSNAFTSGGGQNGSNVNGGGNAGIRVNDNTGLIIAAVVVGLGYVMFKGR